MTQFLETTRFGKLEIGEEAIISFPDGIPGFESHTDWILFGEDETPIKWLQSLSNGDVALPVVISRDIRTSYSPKIADEDLASLQAESDRDYGLMVVLSIPSSEPWNMTANLRAPIVLNHAKRVGKQVICMNEEYSVREFVFSEKDRGAMRGRMEEKKEETAAAPREKEGQ